MSEDCYQFISNYEQFRPLKDITKDLEEGSDEKKYAALKEVILLHMNGQPQPKMLMSIIRYVLPSPHKPLKKLMLYYWEIIPKRVEGTNDLREEIILVCERLRRDLEHPNEYVRGATLRLLSKLHEADILEPLIPAILENLECRRGYVRRNAILTVYSIAKDDNLKHLIPDAAETISELLEQEVDVSAKRNAFLMLQDCAPDKAAAYLRSILKNVSSLGNLFQLQILRLLKSMCIKRPSEKFKYLRIISSLINSKSNAVLYQCANTLTELSSSPVAIRTAARCFTKLLLNETDSNVKNLVFGRIIELRKRHPKYLQDTMSDLLRIMKTSGNEQEIRLRILEGIHEMVSTGNILEVLTTFKNEVVKSKKKGSTEKKKEETYRSAIFDAMNEILSSHVYHYDKASGDIAISRKLNPETMEEVYRYYLFLLEHIGGHGGWTVISTAKALLEVVPSIRSEALDLIYSNLCEIKIHTVYAMALWCLAEYSDTADTLLASFDSVFAEISPILKKPEEAAQPVDDIPDDISVGSSSYSYGGQASRQPVVREDGTYQTLHVDEGKKEKGDQEKKMGSSLVDMLMKAKSFFLHTAVAGAMAKIALKLRVVCEDQEIVHKYNAKAMLVLCALIRSSWDMERKMDKDSNERIRFLLSLLMKKDSGKEAKLLVEEGRKSFRKKMKEIAKKEFAHLQTKSLKFKQANKVDQAVQISQLLTKTFDAFAEEDVSLQQETNLYRTKALLGTVVQMSGCNDEIYAEVSLKTNEYDVVMEILLVNQTKTVLSNIGVELNTQGDLKVCEVPQTYTLEPGQQITVKVSVKVSSTETGAIYGNIAYQVLNQTKWKYIVLNKIDVNTLEYIHPKYCSEVAFRSKWGKFEWENKILVKGKRDMPLTDYVRDLGRIMKMEILTSFKNTTGKERYLSANLYAVSNFGEAALVNVSLEKNPVVVNQLAFEGICRIRAKTCGIARCLGDAIKEYQKKHKERTV